ncbi:MAG: EAL domain-containing protein [Legionellales bacterium]|nr:EAL domain-containing protein [Legionellales bacterium]
MKNKIIDEIVQEIDRLVKANHQFAIIAIKIEQFSHINTILGFHIGDQLLHQINKRLHEYAQNCFIRKLDHAEFIVIHAHKNQLDLLDGFVRELKKQLINLYHINKHELQIALRVGLTTYPNTEKNAQNLLHQAKIAMNHEIESPHQDYVIYHEEFKQSEKIHHLIQQEICKGLKEEEFILHYQPKIDLRTGEICGVEAVARWNHPTLGLIQPKQFIGVCENAGLISQIEKWTIKQAFSALKEWQDLYHANFHVAVNLSTKELINHTMIDFISNIIDEKKINPRQIEVEITESLLMENYSEYESVLYKIHDLGIHLALDDFGTGYSSLHYLTHFPFDIVKLDKAFVDSLLTNSKSKIITKAIFNLCKELGLTTVAEGIETRDQFDCLREMNCDQVQGFYLSPPLTQDKISAFVNTKGHLCAERLIQKSSTHPTQSLQLQQLNQLKEAHHKIKHNFYAAIELFSSLIAMHERNSGGNSHAIALQARDFAEYLGLSKLEQQTIYYAGLLHNLGKFALPLHLVNKPFFQLSREEREEYKKHPQLAESTLLRLEELHDVIQLLKFHREYWDGNGYPHKVSKSEIPVGSRILNIVIEYHELQHGHILEECMSTTKAQAFLTMNSNTRYDPRLVKKFIEFLNNGTAQEFALSEIHVHPEHLQEGMILNRDLVTQGGMVLLRKNQILNRNMITMIQKFHEAKPADVRVYIKAK